MLLPFSNCKPPVAVTPSRVSFAGFCIKFISYSLVKSVVFSRTEDGEELAEHSVKGVIIRLTTVEAVNINQGFVAINSDYFTAQVGKAIDYFTNIKTATKRWFEVSVEPYISRILSDNPGQYILPAQYNNNKINSIALGGHESASVLGEGTIIEFWAFGYWE